MRKWLMLLLVFLVTNFLLAENDVGVGQEGICIEAVGLELNGEGEKISVAEVTSSEDIFIIEYTLTTTNSDITLGNCFSGTDFERKNGGGSAVRSTQFEYSAFS